MNIRAKFDSFKSKVGYVRRRWILIVMLGLALFSSYKLFFHFYQLQKPYVLKTAIRGQYDAQNDLAICSQQLDEALKGKQTAIEAANPDLFGGPNN